MKKELLILLCMFIGEMVYAQKGVDTVVYNLPVVNGKLIYQDSILVTGKSIAALDSTAKRWFDGSFKYHQTLKKTGKDTLNMVFGQGVLEFDLKPALVSIPFYLIITLQIEYQKGHYKYKMYDIYFRPQNGALNAIGYERNPEELIKLYKQKHIGFIRSMSIDRHMIRKYLVAMNTTIQNCIASLNRAMIN